MENFLNFQSLLMGIMAWFFLMVTSKRVPHSVAQTVVEDALNGFAYLPQRDIDVVRHWLHQPYNT